MVDVICMPWVPVVCHTMVRTRVRTRVRTVHVYCTFVHVDGLFCYVGPRRRRCVPRCVDQGSDTTPGLAAETYAAVKAAKYADNFIRFMLETGGRVKKLARVRLHTLTLQS